MGQPPRCPECLHRTGQVVQHFEGDNRVVRTGQGRIGDVRDDEPHPIGDPRGLGVAARGLDRRRVDVETVDLHARVADRERDRRPALAAAELGDRAPDAECGVQVWDLRQPFLDQLAGECGPVERSLHVLDLLVRVRNAPAGPKRGLHRRQHPTDGFQESAERDQVCRTLRVEQHRRTSSRQAEAPLLGPVVCTVNPQ